MQALLRTVRKPSQFDIVAAGERLRPHLPSTPLVAGHALGEHVHLKLETLQPTGSFKVRGALAALSLLEPGSHVVTASAGNHGLGIAWAADRLGLDATVVVPENAAPSKLAALASFPVELEQHGSNYDAAERHGLALAESSGARYVSPYNDGEVIAGQATILAELLEQLEAPFTIVTPIGGGGLAAGLGLAASEIDGVRIVGVECEASAAMCASLAAGRIVRIDPRPTVADGLGGNLEPGSVTFELIRDHVDRVEVVGERDVLDAMSLLARSNGLLVEGAGAAAAAAVLSGRVLVEGPTVVLVTGRNVSLEQLRDS